MQRKSTLTLTPFPLGQPTIIVNMSQPEISVILPTRARPHLLARAVASVFAQTKPDFELIVVDDNPPQIRAATHAALEPWQGDARLRIVGNPVQRNAATGRDTGLDCAGGQWITYLDDDDEYEPTKLAAQSACANDTGAPLVLCGLKYCFAGRTRNRQCTEVEYGGDGLLLATQPGTPVLFHRRLAEVRFDPTLDAGEDAEFFLRLVAVFGVTVVPNVPAPLVRVYLQPASQRVNVRALALWSAQRLILVKHAPRYSRAAGRLAAARAGLARCRWRSGGWSALARASWRLLAVGGRDELRLVANTWALRVPFLRQLVVS